MSIEQQSVLAGTSVEPSPTHSGAGCLQLNGRKHIQSSLPLLLLLRLLLLLTPRVCHPA